MAEQEGLQPVTMADYPGYQEPWRQQTVAEGDEFITWTKEQLADRWDKGTVKYQSDRFGFQGDPIDYAIKETLDTLFYLWYARRQRDWAYNPGDGVNLYGGGYCNIPIPLSDAQPPVDMRGEPAFRFGGRVNA